MKNELTANYHRTKMQKELYRMVNPGDFRRAQTMWLYYGTKRYKRHSGTLRKGMLILNPSGREQRQFPRI